ncbi:MAG: hypothetical protein CML68_24825 [Rhodobacteraceae bacterium]|nr:hypothetical protein [Paracoccaceae bacterium]
MGKFLKPKLLRSRGGSLMLIAALLIGSGVLRLALEAGPALARSEENKKSTNSPNSDSQHVQASDPSQPMPDRTGLQSMLEAFQEREARIVERERLLEERSHAVDIADRAVTKKLQALIEAEEKLRETLSMADGAVEKDIARLTVVYETMKPKEAAALFEEMAPEFAAGFLSRMRPEAAAQIMTGLSSEAAYTISVVMAGRNSQVPIE